jgi:nucleotide-binding universal stress UspA family protein
MTISLDPQPPTPLQQVVISLDGSAVAESALRPGFAIAQRANACVTLLRAIDAQESESSCTDYLRRAGERFAGVATFDVVTTGGPPADALLDATASGSALLCMASRGRGAVSRLVFGSVAEEVLRRSAGPVVVVGPSSGSLPLLSETAWLLCCTDGSQAAERAAPAAAWFAQALELGTVVVQSIGPDESVSLDPEAAPPTPVRDAATLSCSPSQLRAVGAPCGPPWRRGCWWRSRRCGARRRARSVRRAARTGWVAGRARRRGR